jgi:hypothetical protein
MVEGIAATFEVGDDVTVLQNNDRGGGGPGAVIEKIGTGADTLYTVRYTSRHKKYTANQNFRGSATALASFTAQEERCCRSGGSARYPEATGIPYRHITAYYAIQNSKPLERNGFLPTGGPHFAYGGTTFVL